MAKVLAQTFFERNVVDVARDLVGKYIVSKIGKKTERLLITEAEAYGGEEDLASHARFGKTARSALMYGEAGVFYIYLVYGMHLMLNVVTGKVGSPSAVLIRAVETATGPGRVAKRLGIKKILNGAKIGKSTGLWFEENPDMPRPKTKKMRRVGIDYAGAVWSKKPYRFVLTKTNPDRSRGGLHT